jgi:DNA-binding CsgD family transcriptional regulator
MTAAPLARDSLSDRPEKPEAPSLSEIVEAIGREGFAEQVLDYLNRYIGADHCAIFQLKNYELSEVASASLVGAAMMPKSDLTSYEVKRQLSQVGPSGARVDVCNIMGTENTRGSGVGKRQRIMICEQKANVSYCLRILRSAQRESLSEQQIDYLRLIAHLLISFVARHVDLFERKPNLTPALTSLEEIQSCVSGATDLSRRESEVCARILYGLSSCGIALDLGIGKESVMTYRKRAYQRLGIGSQRELLMWYLALWSTLHGGKTVGDVIAVN